MDSLLKVIVAALFVASTLAQLLENLHGPHGARNPARLTKVLPLSSIPDITNNDWIHEENNAGDSWIEEYPGLDDNSSEYKNKSVIFEYLKPRLALQNYLQYHKSLPVHYGVIDWDEVRRYLNDKTHNKGKVVVSPSKVAKKKTIKYKTLKKLETALKNNSGMLLWRSKEQHLTGNVYDLTDPNNAWNMYIKYGIKGPVMIRKSILGTTKYILQDPLVLLKGILQRHSNIPTLANGYIDWNKVFKLSDSDLKFFKSQLIFPSIKPIFN
ncbi:hypothetical protein K1T71_011545 [Dendrolimus kikuchii]|uniref:Uncharacterized protein n=1 Tax=Dendrolimus kikuchii TaxID=765133 RepID=A0ACC1CP34_9NEOP|nr:hypothetical protein K1T71_011545 [Dendrolimus kikuchii]